MACGIFVQPVKYFFGEPDGSGDVCSFEFIVDLKHSFTSRIIIGYYYRIIHRDNNITESVFKNRTSQKMPVVLQK